MHVKTKEVLSLIKDTFVFMKGVIWVQIARLHGVEALVVVVFVFDVQRNADFLANGREGLVLRFFFIGLFVVGAFHAIVQGCYCFAVFVRS